MCVNRKNYEESNLKLGVMNHRIEGFQEKMHDLMHMEVRFAETEEFLGTILPLRIQNAIYENLKTLPM